MSRKQRFSEMFKKLYEDVYGADWKTRLVQDYMLYNGGYIALKICEIQ